MTKKKQPGQPKSVKELIAEARAEEPERSRHAHAQAYQ